ncbi:hypothetical protein [Butyrivibrio sp. VCB2001]|jgi:hypothetical protein|uniref:hypothetical protein n=1 Tax=Butyrivibrio sp. VCB2001 TaxID=1280667 RepID=UPI00041CF261|nr:hypothetical protein [Butyrivibrio sp. VCB2001]
MVSASLDMLEESLVKKLEIMSKIREENARQKEILSDLDNVEISAFDNTLDVKGELIDQLNAIDDGFQTMFDKVKDEVGENKDKYAEQIKRIQKLIHSITDASVSIEAEERRNKSLAEKYFNGERERFANGKRSAAAAFNYYQTMSKSKDIPPQFMDKKN